MAERLTSVRAALQALAVALALAGCAGDGAADVGSPCTSGAECPASPTRACIVPWPDGYCTEIACDVGSCPNGSRCVRGITFVDVPFDAFCLATCESLADCRPGYRCANLSLPEAVCVPENP